MIKPGLEAQFARQTRAVQVGAALGLVVLIGLLDYYSGPYLSLAVLYLVPVFVAARFAGRPAALLVAFASGWAWYQANDVPGVYPGTGMLFWNALAVLATCMLFADVLATRQQREHELARTDTLTAVANRRAFYERAYTELQRTLRYKSAFSIVYLDVDDLKHFNDARGASEGDALLLSLAGTLHRTVRSVDLVARLGGDEFAVLLPETGTEACRVVVNKIRAELVDMGLRRAWPVTVSVAAVTYVVPPRTLDDLIRVADDLLFAVKKKGRGQAEFEVYD